MHSVFDKNGVRDVWDVVTGEYKSQDLRFGDSFLEGGAIADIQHKSETQGGPVTVTLNAGAHETVRKRLDKHPELAEVLTEADLPEIIALALLHEVGHHALGHTELDHIPSEADQYAADDWAEGEYLKLAQSGKLKHLSPEKLKAVRVLMCRG